MKVGSIRFPLQRMVPGAGAAIIPPSGASGINGGAKPNSDAMRIMISACRLAIARYGDCIGKPVGDFIIVPYFWICSMASAHIA